MWGRAEKDEPEKNAVAEKTHIGRRISSDVSARGQPSSVKFISGTGGVYTLYTIHFVLDMRQWDLNISLTFQAIIARFNIIGHCIEINQITFSFFTTFFSPLLLPHSKLWHDSITKDRIWLNKYHTSIPKYVECHLICFYLTHLFHTNSNIYHWEYPFHTNFIPIVGRDAKHSTRAWSCKINMVPALYRMNRYFRVYSSQSITFVGEHFSASFVDR